MMDNLAYIALDGLQADIRRDLEAGVLPIAPMAGSSCSTCGQVELLQAGRSELWRGGGQRQTRSGFLQAVALAFELEHDGPMHEPVEDGGPHGRVAEVLPQSCTTRLEVMTRLRRSL